MQEASQAASAIRVSPDCGPSNPSLSARLGQVTLCAAGRLAYQERTDPLVRYILKRTLSASNLQIVFISSANLSN